MKIVHTESSCGWGGQEIRILEESRGLIKRGHTVTILCPEKSIIYKEARRYSVPVISLTIDKKKISGAFALYRWLKNNPVDIINTHSSTDSWLTAFACKFLPYSPPIVRTRHISAPIPNNFSSKWLYSRSASHIITTGKALREQVIKETGTASSNVTSIPTGIDTNRFHPRDKKSSRIKIGIDPDTNYIGIVATLRSWKGHEFLIDAFSTLDIENWKLIIVGDGPQMQTLTKKISTLKLENKVICSGQQPAPEHWFNAMDIFCLPSYANEGVPQSVLQAMLSGLPIITTPVGAILDAVKNNESAYVVPPKDSDSLAHAIHTLIEAPEIRSQLGKKARAIATENFTLEKMLNEMESLFISIRHLP